MLQWFDSRLPIPPLYSLSHPLQEQKNITISTATIASRITPRTTASTAPNRVVREFEEVVVGKLGAGVESASGLRSEVQTN